MKFLPSLEVALKRRRRSKPWKIALLSALFPPFFLILAYRQRSPLYFISFVFFAALGIGCRWLLIDAPDPVEILTFNSGEFDLESWIFNQIVFSNYVHSFFYGCLGLWFAGHLRVFDPGNPYPYQAYLIDRDIYKEQSKRAQQERYERDKNRKDKTNKKNNVKSKTESYKEDKNTMDKEKLERFERFTCFNEETDKKLSCKIGSKSIEIEYNLILLALIENEYHIPPIEYILVNFRAGLIRNIREETNITLDHVNEALSITYTNPPIILYSPHKSLYIESDAEVKDKLYQDDIQIRMLNKRFIDVGEKVSQLLETINLDDLNDISKSDFDKLYPFINEFIDLVLPENERLVKELKVNKDSEIFDWSYKLTKDQKAFYENENKVENETFSEFLERFYKKQVSSKPKSKPTTKTKDIFYRNVGTCSPDDLLLKSDSEIYELVKYQLLHLTRGTRTSEAGEVEYLKGLLKKLRNSSNS